MRIHTAWLKATIGTVPAVASKVFITDVKYPAPNEGDIVAPPYVVIHPAEGTDRSERLAGPAVTQNPRWMVHSVGKDPDQAALIGELVKKKLIVAGVGVVPTIAGELPGRVWYSSPTPIQIDRDVKPPEFFHVAECGFSSDPA